MERLRRPIHPAGEGKGGEGNVPIVRKEYE
jgi:hypothetical protein